MKREVREQRLHDLIERYIAHLTRGNAHDTTELSVDIIAHSPESPIALAVSARMTDLKAAGVTLRAIFALTDPEPAMARWLSEAAWVRWARDGRLMEAHEQLVLGATRCWSGDAMRRGSTKTDLFESLNEGHRQAAMMGRQAFERLAPLTTIIRPRRVTASLNALPSDRPNVQPVALDGMLPTGDLIVALPTLVTRH